MSGSLLFSSDPSGVIGTFNVGSISSTYSVKTTDNLLLCNDGGGSFAITLPSAANVTGHNYVIKKINNSLSTAVSILTTSSQTIDEYGGGSLLINTQWESFNLISDGSNWQISSHKTITPWTAYSPTFSGAFGTVPGTTFLFTRIGDSLSVRGSFTTGTAGASLGFFTIPSGLVVNGLKIPSGGNNTGVATSSVGNWFSNGANSFGPLLTATGTSGILIYYGQESGGANSLITGNASAVLGNATFQSVNFTVPIVGWAE